MKRFKKVALTLLSTALVAAPLLTSCQPSEDNSSSQAAATVKSIAITKMPTKTAYESGDIFDPTGMEVTATMSDGTTNVVTDYTYSKAALTAEDKRVKITYKGKTAYVDITVTFVLKATSIVIEELPTKTKYVAGEKFDPTGMKVVAMMNDSTKKVVTDYDYDKKDALTTKDTVVTITYENLKASVTITVEDVSYSGIEITAKPTKLAYLVGEKFDTTGMKVSAVKNDGSKDEISLSEVEVNKKDALTLDDTIVNVTYKTFTTSLKISVSQTALTGIRVEKEMDKKVYWEGDKLDLTGLEIYATYKDAEDRKLENVEMDIDKDVLAKEDTKVTFSFGGFKQEIAITVKEKITSVVVDSLKTVRVEGEHLDTSKAALREDFIKYGRGFIENGNNASNGQNICGYNPGSIFEINITTDKDCEIIISSIMSDTNLGYDINAGVRFKIDDTVLTADQPNFTFENKGDYWNWVDFKIGKVSLTAGKHVFSLESINQRPNIDCFDFKVVKYGDQEATKVCTGISVKSAPTKTEYTAGETFDPTGMEIVANYDDFTSETVTDYTIDKTGPLAETDDKVTISYGGFTCEVKIQVGKLYTAKINGTGTKKIEAEDLDTTNLVHRADMPEAGYVKDNSAASGGKSIERYDVGSKFTIDILVGETSTVKFSIFASDANGDKFDSVVTVKLDDVTITSTNPTLSSSATSQYYNWQEAAFDLGELSKGDHTITIEMTSDHPNLDYISFFTSKYGSETIAHTLESISIDTKPTKTDYIVGETFDPTGMVVKANYSDNTSEVITDYTIDKTGALTLEDTTVTITYNGKTVSLTIKVKSGVDFTVSEAKTVTMEAEDSDWSTLVPADSGVAAEENTYSSGGKSIGHISGGYLQYTFETTEEFTLDVKAVMAKFEAVKVSDLISSFKIDGTVATFDDLTLGGAEGNQWFNFKECNVTCGTLAAGKHTFRIDFKGGPNLDCFKFVFTK